MNSASDPNNQVYDKVDKYVKEVIENDFANLMSSDLAVPVIKHFVPEYDGSWCLEDYPPEMEELVAKAMDALKNATMYALFYNARK